jgi:pimeloyl-ACP methyl ester carboxylesterase
MKAAASQTLVFRSFPFFDLGSLRICRRFFRFDLVLAACGFLLIPALGLAASLSAPVRHRVHTEGQGRPTIVFESGLGDSLETWSAVQERIANNCALTIAYNRAGYPGSGPPHTRRDAESVVGELREELRSRDIAPPYVLVGHSLGGLYMQYFARRFPDEVAGLVLVDSTHWNQQLLLGAPTQRPANKRSTVVLFMNFIARRELADSAAAGEQVHTSPRAGQVPTIVLSSTGVFRGETPTSRTEAARLQEDIVADFPSARHIRVENSGHYIHKDRPDVVIDSIRKLAGCAARG